MFAIAVTFPPWLFNLRRTHQGDTVNFWTPTDWKLRKLKPGDRVYFMLKAPYRMIGGYGSFLSYEMSSPSVAWDKFGTGNGVTSEEDLRDRAIGFAKKQKALTADLEQIGCMTLEGFTALENDDFVDLAETSIEFKREIVKLKHFDVSDEPLLQLIGTIQRSSTFQLINGEPDREAALRKRRDGQAAFRAAVIAAYGGRCAVTGTGAPHVLEAAHIQPYIDHRSNHIGNGLALRVDIHRLFDRGLIWIDEESRCQVADSLNRTPYRRLAGRTIALPRQVSKSPSSEALRAHAAACLQLGDKRDRGRATGGSHVTGRQSP